MAALEAVWTSPEIRTGAIIFMCRGCTGAFHGLKGGSIKASALFEKPLEHIVVRDNIKGYQYDYNLWFMFCYEVTMHNDASRGVFWWIGIRTARLQSWQRP